MRNKLSGWFNLFLIIIVVCGLIYIHNYPEETSPVSEETKAEIAHILSELGESVEFGMDKILSLFGYEKKESEADNDSETQETLSAPVEAKNNLKEKVFNILDKISIDKDGSITMNGIDKVVDIDDILESENSKFEKVYLTKIVDGDTFYVTNCEDKIIKIRLIGIDTPESVHSDESRNNEYGTMASDNTKDILKDISTLYLQYDKDKKDQYNRTLAYAWLTDEVDTDNIEDIKNYMLNGIILAQGYAVDRVYQPNDMYADDFSVICDSAEENNVGLWQYEDYRTLVAQ